MKYEKVLFEREIAELAQVKTTKTQARQIKERNVALLKRLRSLKPHLKGIWSRNRATSEKVVPQGCCHCKRLPLSRRYDCNHCAWKLPRLKHEETVFCGGQSFGGVVYNTGRRHNHFVVLDTSSCMIAVAHHRLKGNQDFRKFTSDYRRSEKFLLAHIQWADMIISGEMVYVPPKKQEAQGD